MAFTDSARVVDAGLRVYDQAEVDLVRGCLENATDSITLNYPLPSTWTALTHWSKAVTPDTDTVLTVFRTQAEEYDQLAVYGALLAMSPSGTMTDTAFADRSERVVQGDVARRVFVALGTKWAMENSLVVAADPNRLKRIAVIGTRALGNSMPYKEQ